MAEAQLTRASSGGGSCLFAGMTLDQYNALIEDRVIIAASQDSSGESTYRTTGNYTFTAPKTTSYEVLCVGGGGGGGAGKQEYDYGGGGYYYLWGGGAGSGYYKSTVVSLNRGEIVSIYVGAGGAKQISTSGTNNPKYGSTGGTSSFGSYVSAIGGGGGGAVYRQYDSDGTSWYVNGTKGNSGGKLPNYTHGATGWTVPDLTNGSIGGGGNGGYNNSDSDMYSTCSNGTDGAVYIRWN